MAAGGADWIDTGVPETVGRPTFDVIHCAWSILNTLEVVVVMKEEEEDVERRRVECSSTVQSNT